MQNVDGKINLQEGQRIRIVKEATDSRMSFAAETGCARDDNFLTEIVIDFWEGRMLES